MDKNHFWNLLAKKLSGEASEKEIEELSSLINSHPELSYPAQHIADVWKLEPPKNKMEAEKAFQKHFSVLQKLSPAEADMQYQATGITTKSSKIKWLFPGVVLFIVCLSAALFIWSRKDRPVINSLSRQTEEIYTRPGTRNKIVLPDSSVVWLNADSKLSYSRRFGVKDRVVTLSGEAFFDVVKNEKPFIIHTSDVKIKVVGTAFNVRSYPNEKQVETSLIRGQVEVTLDKSPEKKYTLKTSEKLTLNMNVQETKDTKTKTGIPLAVVSTVHYLDNSTIAETSWVENKLVFADESFEDIAKKMERWYGTSIRFKQEKIKAERFTGIFEKETVWQALEAMQMTSAFEFTIKDNEITISH